MNVNVDMQCAAPGCTSKDARELPSGDAERTKLFLTQSLGLNITEDSMLDKVMVCQKHLDDFLMEKEDALDTVAPTVGTGPEVLDTTPNLLIPVTFEPHTERKSITLTSTKRSNNNRTVTTSSNKKKKTLKPDKPIETSELTHSIIEIQKVTKPQCTEYTAQLGVVIYLKYPNLYRMCHSALHLPPVSELKQVFLEQGIPMSLFTNSTIIKQTMFYKVMNMSEIQKQCVVCVGEIEVKPNLYYDIKLDKLFGFSDINDIQKPQVAHVALVLSVQGLFSEWNQLVSIAFIGERKYLISPEVIEWILINIRSLVDIGYIVVGFITAGSIYDLSNAPLITRRLYVPKNKMVYIHDVSYLLKQFYFNFVTSDYEISRGSIAKMQHILDYYRFDRNRTFRLTPKLTATHFKKPKNIDDFDMKHIQDVISFETAAAMSTYVDAKLLSRSAVSTIKLIGTMSILFDILHSDNIDESTTVATGETQLQYLSKVIPFLRKLKLVNNKEEYKVEGDTLIKQFIITITSIMSLYDDYKKNKDLESFPMMKRLRLNYTNTLFDRARQTTKDDTKPTCKNVFSVFKQSTCMNILKPIIDPKKKCTEIQKAMYSINVIIRQFHALPQRLKSIGQYITISPSEYNTFKPKKRDMIVLMAGFLMMKCYHRHEYFCQEMHDYIQNIDVTSSIGKIIEKEGIQNGCLVPHENFIEFIEVLEIKFQSFMTKDALHTDSNRLVSGLLKSVQNVTFCMPCRCFPLLYAKTLFMRVRIMLMLIKNNKNFKKSSNFVV